MLQDPFRLLGGTGTGINDLTLLLGGIDVFVNRGEFGADTGCLLSWCIRAFTSDRVVARELLHPAFD